jgi:hypothetical protein
MTLTPDLLWYAAGILCIVIAIMGGGLRIVQFSVPALQSVPRQLLLGGVGVALVIAAYAGALPGTGRHIGKGRHPRADAAAAQAAGDVWMGPLEQATNRQGDDFDAFGVRTENAQLCAERCRTDPACKAMTYVIPTHICWPKGAVPAASHNSNMISAVKGGKPG